MYSEKFICGRVRYLQSILTLNPIHEEVRDIWAQYSFSWDSSRKFYSYYRQNRFVDSPPGCENIKCSADSAGENPAIQNFRISGSFNTSNITTEIE
jgi:hypothetical protein